MRGKVADLLVELSLEYGLVELVAINGVRSEYERYYRSRERDSGYDGQDFFAIGEFVEVSLLADGEFDVRRKLHRNRFDVLEEFGSYPFVFDFFLALSLDFGSRNFRPYERFVGFSHRFEFRENVDFFGGVGIDGSGNFISFIFGRFCRSRRRSSE